MYMDMENKDLLDWVSKNYTPDNGIGYWLPIENIDGDSITSFELLEEWNREKLRKEKESSSSNTTSPFSGFMSNALSDGFKKY